MSMPMSRRRSPGRRTTRRPTVATRTSTAAGSSRRIRRPTNRIHEIVPLRVQLGDEQPGDEEAGDDEEDVDADEAAAQRQAGVVAEHGEDGDGPQTLDVGTESCAPPRRPAVPRRRSGSRAVPGVRASRHRVGCARAAARPQPCHAGGRRGRRAPRRGRGRSRRRPSARPPSRASWRRARRPGRPGRNTVSTPVRCAVHQGHRPLVGDVPGAAAHALDDDVGAELAADVDEQPLRRTPRPAPVVEPPRRRAPARRSRSAPRR